MQLLTYAEWASHLHARGHASSPGRLEVRIGVDGAGASGKSTIARQLALASADIQVIALDDFYRPSQARFRGPVARRPVAADYDLERLKCEVLEPLAAGRPASYRRYDWAADAVGAEFTAVLKPSVVVEGVYATSLAVAAFFDITVWVDCPRELRLGRGLARDGEAARERWELDWMPGEDLYMTKERPSERATFICDGARDDLAQRVSVIHGL